MFILHAKLAFPEPLQKKPRSRNPSGPSKIQEVRLGLMHRVEGVLGRLMGARSLVFILPIVLRKLLLIDMGGTQ